MKTNHTASYLILSCFFFSMLFSACSPDSVVDNDDDVVDDGDPIGIIDPDPDVSAIEETFQGRIDLDNLHNYANQSIPNYINKDNTTTNPITDAGATLGRVLFYDKELSFDRTVSCASCHKQSLAFGDELQASEGVAGTTGRHSMRLVNARFANETRFFWDERAPTLEFQTTQPIQDHIEMGFSGAQGDPDIEALIDRLSGLEYYQELFRFVYGDATVTEERMQTALAQFVRSIQSFDSKYDVGRAQVGNNNQPFPNFTQQENLGKNLFMTPPQVNPGAGRVGGGVGCGGCHRAPEFDIDPNSRNNGVIASIVGNEFELNITRSPSLRDIFGPDGQPNGPLMHTGDMDFEQVLNHYDRIDAVGNPNLDRRLTAPGPGGGAGQQLNLTQDEREAVTAFIHTLSGNEMYTAERWSDPFPQ
ncbi:MAG: cytochrome-c peroxidase [Bacteroidota bacterium]